MSETKKIERHLEDEKLWGWRDGGLNEVEVSAAKSHLENCTPCQQRTKIIARFIKTMRKVHYAVQPTLSEQMQLVRALEEQFIPQTLANMLADASRQLVQWLAPAVAILVTLLVLLRQENSSQNDLASLLPETPESRLLLSTTDDQLQQAMLDLALSNDENPR